ncbi:MAG: glycosyltransferase family 4 protein, partial [Anaerolineales bacterium]|nr:glycosyltransferase family 4 protein [Anaerolineales bacterium]
MDNARPVIFLDHAPALGGAEHSLLLLLRFLDRARWSPHLACAGGPLAERAGELDVPSYSIIPSQRLRGAPLHALGWLAGARRIARLAAQVGAAILVANTVRTAFYGALAARMARIPFVWHMRDFWLSETQPRHAWTDRLLKQALCASARRVIANSAATAQHLPCGRKVTVVHNGIDSSAFDPALDPAPFRSQHGIPLDAPVVG